MTDIDWEEAARKVRVTGVSVDEALENLRRNFQETGVNLDPDSELSGGGVTTQRNETTTMLRANFEALYENVMPLDRKALYRLYGALNEALAAERRATVERIRSALLLNEGEPIPEDYAKRVLDEEAAR